ncbi:MAG: VCBS repeat-containing protein [Planctomycetes bacterium]|nr:VCBS repeat-containing protein [Planctomycetota bacterium]
MKWPALLLVFLAAAPRQDDSRNSNISITKVTFGGRRDRHLLYDLNGDGRLDIVLISYVPVPLARFAPAGFPLFPSRISPRTERRIDIFWNTPSGFSQESRATYVVPRSARAFSIADVLPAPGKEIILFDEAGALAATTQFGDTEIHSADAFRRICDIPAFFDYPSETSLPNWDLVLFGRETASDSIVTPTPDGFVILRADGSGNLKPADVFRVLPAVSAESSTNRFFSVTKSLPRPFLADLDGDGNTDFFVCDPSGAPQMIVYYGKPGGRFAREAAVRPSPPLRRELKSDNLIYEMAEAVDLNHDGVCDFIVSHTEGNIGLWDTLTTSQLIYFGRKGTAGFDPRPDQVVSSAGVSIVPQAIDFDGDGFKDLLVSSYRTDLLSNIKNAVLNSAKVSYFLFLMENGKYPANPTVERDVELDFKVLERGGVEPRAYFSGDFDGDGVNDLLAVEEEKLIRVYKGTRRKAGLIERGGYDFATKPMMVIELRATNDLQIIDMDGDGRAEIVIPDAQIFRIIQFAPK